MSAFPLKISDTPSENIKPADPIRDFVLNPANEIALKDALRLVTS